MASTCYASVALTTTTAAVSMNRGLGLFMVPDRATAAVVAAVVLLLLNYS